MAFQAPVMNIASATGEMLPSIQSTLSAPWRISKGRPSVRIRSLDQERSLSTKPTDNTAAKTFRTRRPPVELPECLASVPVQRIKPPIAHHNTLVPALLFGSQFSASVLRAANTHKQYGLQPSARTYSTFTTSGISTFIRPRVRQSPMNTQRRTVFGVGAPSQAHLISLEASANKYPTSASNQNNFYAALLRANMPQIVIERFESGQFASNKSCEEAYQKALTQTGAADGSALASSQVANQSLNDIVTSAAVRANGQFGKFAKITGGSGTKATPVHVMIDEPWRSVIFKWVKLVLGYGLTAYFGFVFLSFCIEVFGILKPRSNQVHGEATAQQQTAKFSDVHGCDEAKAELQELVAFLKDPEKFSALGGKLPKGVLLVGPPGTGKTLLARAVAGEAGVPFFYMSGSEFDEMYVGVGAKRVRELFKGARAKAPAIVFIDELDAIGAKRNERDPTYVKQSLNQLLTELDGFSQETGVIILGATNFPKALDKALTRPGRFDRNVVVGLPDVRGRMKIIQHYLKKVKIGVDIDPEQIARGTPGFSGAQLESLVNQAAVRASVNKTTSVSMVDMEWARDKIMMGAERRSFVIQEKDRLMTAYHEAGHALVGLYTKGVDPLYKVTIIPRGNALGVTHFLPEMDKVSMSKQEMLASLDRCMGGKAAEEIVYGPENVTGGVSSDLTNATSTAWAMVTQLGMSDKIGNIDLSSLYKELSTETRQRIEDEVRSMIDLSYIRATTLLKNKRRELDLLANALIEYEVLDLKEVQAVLRGEKLKRMKGDRKVPIQVNLGAEGGKGGVGGKGPGAGSAGPSGPKGIGIAEIGGEAGATGETTPGVPEQGGVPPSPPPPPPSAGERQARWEER